MMNSRYWGSIAMSTWIDVEEPSDYILPTPEEVQAQRAGLALEMALLVYRDLAPDAALAVRVHAALALQATATLWCTVVAEGGDAPGTD
jgi:hypothetical protein